MRLEERLKLSESYGDGSALLWAQWCFDKKLLTRSLNVINARFPHYSLHDSTHSLTIISEIERILGPNIEFISFVDAWLLLEAAYWHDMGMNISHEEKESVANSKEFRAFLESVKDSESDYSRYARLYLSYQDGSPPSSFVELEKSFTFLLAEFIRRTHYDRSKQFLLEPDLIGVKSPKTGLINSRLLLLLGDIVACHGRDFSSVLDLPFENDGLDVNDMAHPRYVACLLRLGDLLDLDDGRHCPTQLLAVGKLPDLSKAHLEKHRSIVSKSISSHSIELRAKCQTFESFEVQNDWFGYIEKEIENQDKSWGDIAPMGYIGKLPTIKTLICELEDSIPMGRHASRFSLDTNRIFGYLTEGIYENPLAPVLEILQNAVDATIDRIWLEDLDEEISIDSFREKAKKCFIDVSLSSTPISSKQVKYEITVSDAGKGMTLSEIRTLLTIASADNQSKKDALRQGMPSWMRPSGYFGIGLQSVFSIADTLEIETRSPGDQAYKINIRATKGKIPSFVVRAASSKEWKFGTAVKFSFFDDVIPGSLSARNLQHFDPLTETAFSIKESRIAEQVYDFAKFCEFPIRWNGQELASNQDHYKIRDTQNGIEYAIEFLREAHINDWRFRGRPFKSDRYYHKYFNIIGNIISEQADSFLHISRERIHQAGQKMLEEKLETSLMNKKEEVFSKIHNKEMASFFYFLRGNIVNDSWKAILLSAGKLEELLAVDKNISLCPEYEDSLDGENALITNKDNDAILLLDAAFKLGYGVMIEGISRHDVPSKFYINNKRSVEVYNIQFKENNSLSLISDEALKILSEGKLVYGFERHFLPCGLSQYPNISLQPEHVASYPFIIPLTPFGRFFPRGILLRATSKSLDEDLPVLINALKKHKDKDISDLDFDREIREFYQKYPFNTTKSI